MGEWHHFVLGAEYSHPFLRPYRLSMSDFHPFQGSCESMILRHRFKWCKAFSSMPHVGCARPAWVRFKLSMLKPSVNNLISRLTSTFPFPCLARSSSLFTNQSLGRRLFLHVDRSALRPWLRIGSTLVRRNSSERMSVSKSILPILADFITMARSSTEKSRLGIAFRTRIWVVHL